MVGEVRSLTDLAAPHHFFPTSFFREIRFAPTHCDRLASSRETQQVFGRTTAGKPGVSFREVPIAHAGPLE